MIFEGCSEFIDVSEEKASDIIYNILRNETLNGNIHQDEYIVIDDDGIFIGNEKDFDSDVLLFAIPVADVVDFDNISDESEFINMDDVNKALHRVLNNPI